ncbi:type IV secretion system protein [Amycolatopsis roodepoortensis]|uniref:type IV secretion system protein n=1 Tax=Amycolatopsis roodepoortensis TaxID=700274 RepID=UPI00214BFAC9|nr:type IV secretion system protein [Amycolatopsis roodepoortensis]UUV32078.1 type IV secretion system protein [Amycolatopsis roodepoortensis]
MAFPFDVFDGIGGLLGDGVKGMIASAFEDAMQVIWDASLAILRGAFALVDQFSTFTVDKETGPVSILWPMMMWISGVIALGLFFWQLIMTVLRGGRGFMRLVGGPIQYGIALAMTVGMVAALLAASDGLTAGILGYGLQSANFTDALNQTSFADGAVDGVKAAVLGICAVVGVVPAGIGYALEMLFREAAIYVLVATSPLTAAGLLSNATSAWFWGTARMMLACIFMKPVLAETLALGVATAGGSKGLSGLLAGTGILLISLFCPFVLFRLFAFVDPNTDAGAGFRGALSGMGIDSYGPNNPGVMAGRAIKNKITGGGGDDDGDDEGESDPVEDANTGRFDKAAESQATTSMDESGAGQESEASGSGSGGGSAGTKPMRGPWDNASDGDNDDSGGEDDTIGNPAHSFANRGSVVSTGKYGRSSSSDDNGDDPSPPEPPDPGGGGPPTPPSGGGGGGGGGPTSGGGGTAATAQEAAVIL